MGVLAADYYITKEALDWATKENCPSIVNEYIGDIVVKALGYDGSVNYICKREGGGYNLSWFHRNGTECLESLSEEKILNAVKGKVIETDMQVMDTHRLQISENKKHKSKFDFEEEYEELG